MTEGYTTELMLAYGHTSGILPAALTGGSTVDNITQNALCATNSNFLQAYIDKAKYIGGINVQCMVNAFWQYMTCGATTTTKLQQMTPEFQNSAPKNSTFDVTSNWISLNNIPINQMVTWSSSYPQYPEPPSFQPYPFKLNTDILSQLNALCSSG